MADSMFSVVEETVPELWYVVLIEAQPASNIKLITINIFI